MYTLVFFLKTKNPINTVDATYTQEDIKKKAGVVFCP